MESAEHIGLVGIARRYVENRVGVQNANLILVDSSGESVGERVVDNYVPDVYYKDSKCMILGEAKTFSDFDRPHSKRQFDAFIKELCMFSGEKVLVVSVPWQLFFAAKNYFKVKKRKEGYDICIVVLNDCGRCDCV